jgi:glucokinase
MTLPANLDGAGDPESGAPFPWLVADIGGTNARFGWIEHEGGAIEQVTSLRVTEHAGPASAASTYLALVSSARGAAYQAPQAAAWAMATALAGDRVELTNAGWSFSRHEVRSALQLRTLLLLNDFEALALSLPLLAPQQLRRVGEAPAQRAEEGAARAVIGPGTGLGVAGLVAGGAAPAARPRWVAVPGEGGHASLAAADDLEAALLAAVRRRFAHVSAERLLSGIGLPLLHWAVGEVRGQPAAALPADAIVAAGIAPQTAAGFDAQCRETLEHFCALLGGFAGNVALTFGARGGLYVGGGIAPRLGEFFFRSRFRQRFEAKGRFEAYLAAIPTWLIVDTHAAMTGARVALQQRGG